ncbi:aspartate carbamoyltransferase [Candidatus Bipolaricaulota bacterium]|nr:aspartate carbamoyltransferase [Candidatus Bipolaricaulota bacterium]MBS3792082.1 aspartate carbamoyltransferase [Candidatus Bipolaricaulota bacterium]
MRGDIQLPNTFEGTDFITIRDKTREELEIVMDKARQMEQYRNVGTDSARGHLMGTLFFEPSTRTRISFQAAMKRLGGDTVGFPSPEGSSVQKGETLADTLRTVSQYVDILVLRHPSEGSAKLAAELLDIPVMNGGDGSANHPTQTLLDLYTIRKELGKIDGKTITLAGDLRYSRTTRSLARALTRFDVELILNSPEQLKMKEDLLVELEEKGLSPKETNDLESSTAEADLIYATRIQKERFPDISEYKKVAHAYEIDKDLLEKNGEPLLLHPLPRVNEINTDVDDMDNTVFFNQAGNGVPVRMALISLLLDLPGR